MATILGSLSVGALLTAASSAAGSVGLAGTAGALGTAGAAATGFGLGGGAIGALGAGVGSLGAGLASVPGLEGVGGALAAGGGALSSGAGAVGGFAGAAVPGLGGTTVSGATTSSAGLAKTGVETANTIDAAQAAQAAGQAPVVAPAPGAPAPTGFGPEAPVSAPSGADEAAWAGRNRITGLAMAALKGSAQPVSRLALMRALQEDKGGQPGYVPVRGGGGGFVAPTPQIGFGARLAREVSGYGGGPYVPGFGG